MLLKIREKVTGWFAYVVVALISIPFALWGINFYFQSDNDPIVIRIGDRTITLSQYDAELARVRNRFESEGRGVPPYKQLSRGAIGNILRDELLFWGATETNYHVSAAMIADLIVLNPEFHIDGRFDQDRYMQLVGGSSIKRDQYEQSVKNTLLLRHYRNTFLDSNFILDNEKEAVQKLLFEQRNIRYAIFDATDYVDHMTVSEEEAKAYYENNKKNFVSPHKVQVDYVELKIDDIMAEIEVDEEQVREYYENNIDLFQPPEKWELAHILIDPEQHEDAPQRAQDVYEKLLADEDFAELAQTYSDDELSAAKGGKLPPFLREDILDEALAEAIFSLDVNKFSEPVESRFGIQIFKRLEMSSTGTLGFEDIKGEVEEQIKLEQATEIYDTKFLEFKSLMELKLPGALVTASRRIKAELKNTGWQTEDSEEGILQFPEVKNAAFYSGLALSGRDSPVIEVDSGHAIALKVPEEELPYQKEYQEVSEEVYDFLKQRKATEYADKNGSRKVLERINKGVSFDEAIATISTPRTPLIQAPGFIKRDQQDLAASVVSLSYNIPHPTPKKPSYRNARLPNQGGAILIELLEIRTAEIDEAEKEAVEESLDAMVKNNDLSIMLYGLMQDAGISVEEDLIKDER